MEPIEVVYRALDVPDIIRGKALCARHRLVTEDDKAGYGEQVALHLANLTIEAVVSSITSGALDGYMGGFGDQNERRAAIQLCQATGSWNPQDAHGETRERMAIQVLHEVKDYVTRYPFFDQVPGPTTEPG